MLSPVSSSRCICNLIPNGETSLITCSLSAGRSVTPTERPHLPAERLRGIAEFLGFDNPTLPELCPTLPKHPHPHCLPGKLRHEGAGGCSASPSMATSQLVSLPRGGTWCGEALGHFPVAQANLAMALGFPRPCPARAGQRCGRSWGAPSPLRIAAARGVRPAVGPFGVFTGSLTAQPDALGSWRCPQSCATHRAPSARPALPAPVFRAPWMHSCSRRPLFSSSLDGRPAAPLAHCPAEP